MVITQDIKKLREENENLRRVVQSLKTTESELKFPQETALFMSVSQLTKKHCPDFDCTVEVYPSKRFPGQLLVDVNLKKLYDSTKYKFHMAVNVYSSERSDGSRHAVINWQTTGSYSVEFCQGYLKHVQVALILAEQINEIYKRESYAKN